MGAQACFLFRSWTSRRRHRERGYVGRGRRKSRRGNQGKYGLYGGPSLATVAAGQSLLIVHVLFLAEPEREPSAADDGGGWH
jgi:hypothetical protein